MVIAEVKIKLKKGVADPEGANTQKTLELLGNAPNSLNIAHVAEIFGVSRSIIYRDLEALGYERAGIDEK